MSKDGVIPLRHFFDRDVNRTTKTGQNIADEILRIISVESGAKPFSDMQISEMLAASWKQNANTKSKPSAAGSIWKRRSKRAQTKNPAAQDELPDFERSGLCSDVVVQVSNPNPNRYSHYSARPASPRK